MFAGLVSTIIPVHNRPELLIEAVGSVLSQTYRPIEVLVIDDGSTDTTPEVVQQLAHKNPSIVHSLSQQNTGPGGARQAGLDLARGEFIQYLDSDDLLLPRKFEMQIAALIAAPDCGAAYGKTRLQSSRSRNSRALPLKRTGERLYAMFPAMLQSRWWSTSTPLYRRSVLDRAGRWSNLRNEEDWEYECRIAALGIRLVYCDAFVSVTRRHEGEQLSQNGASDPIKLRDRARAHCLIYQHARRAGISHDFPEMQHFARELFLLARQCGAIGLSREARVLFNIARKASGAARGNGLDFRLYELAARLLGWSAVGRLASQIDGFRFKEAVRVE
jgi:hypothetical protein